MQNYYLDLVKSVGIAILSVLLLGQCQEDFVDEELPLRVPGTFRLSSIGPLSDTLLVSVELRDNFELGQYTIGLRPTVVVDKPTFLPPQLFLADTFAIGGQRSLVERPIQLLSNEVASGTYQLTFAFNDTRGVVAEEPFLGDTTVLVQVVNPFPQLAFDGVRIGQTVQPIRPRDTVTLAAPYLFQLVGTISAPDTLGDLRFLGTLLRINDIPVSLGEGVNSVDTTITFSSEPVNQIDLSQVIISFTANDTATMLHRLLLQARLPTEEDEPDSLTEVVYFVRIAQVGRE